MLFRSRGPGVYEMEKEKIEIERNKEARDILLAKETVMSLLLTTNASSKTVSFSKINSTDLYEDGDARYDRQSSDVLVFRLHQGMEVNLDSSTYEDILFGYSYDNAPGY